MHFWCEGAAVEVVLMQMKYFLLLYTAVEPFKSSHYEVATGSATLKLCSFQCKISRYKYSSLSTPHCVILQGRSSSPRAEAGTVRWENPASTSGPPDLTTCLQSMWSGRPCWQPQSLCIQIWFCFMSGTQVIFRVGRASTKHLYN